MYAHLSANGPDKKVQNAFNKAAQYIHTKGSFGSGDLTHEKIKPLIAETYNVLKQGVNTAIETKVPDKMLQKLQNEVFVFSGMKTYAQLKEASLLLLDSDKNIKNFQQFQQDIAKINNTYNGNYLQAEYQHAVSAAQSAAQYHHYMHDGDRYNLQIRTAGDGRVRPAHAALNNITLPANHPFWDTHWTPFDWRCRCKIIQVLTDKYDVTDADVANAAAKEAVPEMFRYNPGKQQVIFPPKHPYYPQHCNGAKLNVTGLIGFAQWLLDAESDRCKAMQIVKKMKDAGISNITKTDTIKVGNKTITYYPELTNKTDNDYKDILTSCKHFVAITNEKVTMLPKLSNTQNNPVYDKIFAELKGTKYEGLCPDFKVGNKFYEVEGFTTAKIENALGNMLKHGLKQSSRLVIQDEGSTDNYIKRQVYQRVHFNKQKIDEVWILRKNGNLDRIH